MEHSHLLLKSRFEHDVGLEEESKGSSGGSGGDQEDMITPYDVKAAN